MVIKKNLNEKNDQETQVSTTVMYAKNEKD